MIIDLFSGPGGWDVGAAWLGLATVGIEVDADACATRAAAGLATIRADVAAWPLERLTEVEGLIASPPCQAFSLAGKQLGHDDLPRIFDAIRRWPEPWSTEGWSDPRSALILEPLRWAWTLRPRWVACEQVKPCIEVWRALGAKLEQAGYKWWAGILNAADFGVPQTRERAIFMASLDGQPQPPAATHARRPTPTLFGPTLERWVSMAAALGWGMDARPCTTIVSGRNGGGSEPLSGGSGARARLATERSEGRWQVGFPRRDDRGDSPDGYCERDWRDGDEPAFALTEKARSWVVRTGANSMVTGRTADDIEPYERSLDEPAPTLDAKAGSAWKLIAGNQPNAAVRDLDEPAPTIAFGHNSAAHRFEEVEDAGSVNTGLWWKKGGDRDDAQERSAAGPAPALTAKSGGQWHLNPPEWANDRPATTVCGRPDVWPPGHKFNQDDIDRLGEEEARARYGNRAGTEAIRLSVEDALVLQSFPSDYPVQGTKTARFRQIGDAIPCLLAYHVLRALDPERA